MDRNKVRFALSGLSDPKSGIAIRINNDKEHLRHSPIKRGVEYIHFVTKIYETKTFDVVDLSYWWDDNKTCLQSKSFAERLMRLLIAEKCIELHEHRRKDWVLYKKTPEFTAFLEQILTIELRLLQITDSTTK